ncbi:MAG: sterol desaturase family protein [Kangiellaceae bacterium]|nr:sterol desaturase family protein [Kangiellaceae bacterium]MCW9015883.1 sterol desaturase family protein [Kangiellaceae bacterium]
MQLLDSLNSSLYDLSRYLIDPSQRIYIWYLVGSLLLALIVFYKASNKPSFARFIQFLFPKKIWLSKSAKNDYVLFVVNKIIRGILLAPAILAIAPIGLSVANFFESTFGMIAPLSQSKWVIMTTFTLLLFVLDDLSRFLLHLILHKVPFLWEIHKVHHSAKVLTPITIYRSHPIENYLFACRLALSQGTSIGIAYFLFGPTLSVIEFAGANIFIFAFNFMGSNLRHSHVWLSWGEKVERWLVSPAQHQIHHSDNPAHFDKNLGSALAIWDRIAGTLITANQVKRIRFGVGKDFKEHDTVWGIYWQPIQAATMKLLSLFKLSQLKKKAGPTN